MMTLYPRKVEEAADLLVHYFKEFARPDGQMTADNITEIRSIAYSLYDAAQETKS